MGIKVYVVIVTYNATRWIEKCFNSLRNSSVNLQIVVVDNKSTDDTLTILRKNFPEVTIIESEVNLGFGKGNNIGIEFSLKAGAEFIFLLNQDAWIFPDTMEKLLSVKPSGIICPVHLDRTGIKLESGFSVYISPLRKTKVLDDFIIDRPGLTYEVPFINAAAWLLPAETIKTIGGFDPIFFHYGEDVNYGQRMKFHGLKFIIVPHAFICHDTKRDGISKILIRYETRHNFLLLLANVNNSEFPLRFLGAHFRLLKSFIKYAATLNFASISCLFSDCWFIVTHLKSIYRSKKQNQLQGPNWLLLE
jgi:N-acetylglucosaminyl-diphospho-decaprenol L-rhamnosyltransferase